MLSSTETNGQSAKSSGVIHYFVDEAGDPTLFDGKGRIVVGDEGCSKYFILGKLDVEEPDALTTALEELRTQLLADPYFKGIPSMQAVEKKTARFFHAKDDLPEVRREVFRLLLHQKVRFFAAVRDKREAASYEARLREKDATYRYKPNEMYDGLVRRLFGSRWYRAALFRICFSRRGKRDRTEALQKAIRAARIEYEANFQILSHATVEITHASPAGNGGLQAVDYFLWALQRFYEYEQTQKRESECRYVEMLGPLIGEIDDMDFVCEGRRGKRWNHWNRPLSLSARQVPDSAGEAHKKVGDIGPEG